METKHKYIVDGILHLSTDKNKDMNTIIKYIYNNYRLDYDLMKNNNIDLIDNSKYDFEEDDYDKNWDICFDGCGTHTVKFEYLNPKFDYNGEHEENVSLELIAELDNYLKTYDASTLQIGNTNSILFSKENGINHDSRGVRKLDWIIKYSPVCILQSSNDVIHFKNIMDALYTIKSHKFEYWYELYCDCQIADTKKGGDFYVACNYDHGS